MSFFGTIMWLAAIACAVWVIYDVATNNKKLSTEMKVVWIIGALLFSIVTAIVYWLIYKKK